MVDVTIFLARLKAVGAPHASDWLFALPIAACGLRLDEAVRVAVGLRLGVNICEPHECRCGSMVKANGAHGLCCSLGPGRVARHAGALFGQVFQQSRNLRASAGPMGGDG